VAETAQTASGNSRRAAVVRTVGLDIVGPLVVYRLCRGAGVPEVWSLVLSGVLPGFGVVFDWWRWRTLEMVGAVVLAGIGVSVALALVTDDPQVVLLEGAILTGFFGLVCLLSVWWSRWRRPLIFSFAQAFYGGRHSADGVEFDEDYETYDEARFYWRVVTIVWGVVYVVEAAVKAVVVTHTSTGRALLFNRTVPWAVYIALMAWTMWWGFRLRRSKPVDAKT
jgi:hypothetical protein